MDAVVRERMDLFVATLEGLRRPYYWSMGDLTQRFVALAYALEGRAFDKEAFDAATLYIRRNTGGFSNYRGHLMHATAALLTTRYENPAAAFDRLLADERALKTAGLPNGGYLPIAAYALGLTCPPDQTADRVARAMALYQLMKKHHFWLTGADDVPVAVLLAASGEDNEALVTAMEDNYEALRQAGLTRGNGLQFLSHLLTFVPGTAVSKAEAVRCAQDRLAGHRMKVSSSYYGTLGYLALLDAARPGGPDSAQEVVEAVTALREHRGFKWANRDMNVLAAAALTVSPRLTALSRQDSLLQTGLHLSVGAMVAAQTAALIAATSAATAGAAAASSG